MSTSAAHPLVSTIVPCYNGERYLSAAIESILVQDYRPIEIIVIDDGSTDRSAEVARGFGDAVRYHVQAHAGIAAARNRGVALATGEVVAFLDADDLWVEGKLAHQMAALEADPSLGIVCGHAEQFLSPELSDEAARVRIIEQQAPSQLPGALLLRRAVFDRVGAYSDRFTTGTEIDWFMRAAEQGVKTLMLPALVLRRRIHTTNHGIIRRDARQDYVRVLKAALDRRRTAP